MDFFLETKIPRSFEVQNKYPLKQVSVQLLK